MRAKFSRALLWLLLIFALVFPASAASRMQYTLLTGASTTCDGATTSIDPTHPMCYQAYFRDVGARTCSATVVVSGSNDGTNWLTLATLTISNTTTTDGAAFDAPWRFVRASITAISLGTGGATPTVTVTGSTVQ